MGKPNDILGNANYIKLYRSLIRFFKSYVFKGSVFETKTGNGKVLEINHGHKIIDLHLDLLNDFYGIEIGTGEPISIELLESSGPEFIDFDCLVGHIINALDYSSFYHIDPVSSEIAQMEHSMRYFKIDDVKYESMFGNSNHKYSMPVINRE